MENNAPSNPEYNLTHRYTDQAYDPETGLYYYGSRYYDPELGRFIQPDPTVPDPVDSQSFNRYSYCRNNPIKRVDPTGCDDEPAGSSDFSYSWSHNTNFDGSWSTVESFSWAGINWSYSTAGGNGWSSYAGSISWEGGLMAYGERTYSVGDYFNDGIAMGGFSLTESVGVFATWEPPPTTPASALPVSPAPAAGGSGGGWLSTATTIAGLASMIPGPIGLVAGAANTVGELLQQHWKEAAVATVGMLLATVGLGMVTGLAKAGRAAKYEVGLAKDLRKASQLYTEANHVPQTAQAVSLIGDYNLANKAGNEVAIRLSVSEHAAVSAAQAARPYVPASARELLAQDIKMLRANTQAPNSALQKIIRMNKELHRTDFTKY